MKHIAEGHIPFYVLFTSTLLLFYLAHHSAWLPQKKYFPGQRRQSVCVWLCPGSWHSSQSSAKRAHTSAQLEWGSHWIDCRSNGNLIPGPSSKAGGVPLFSHSHILKRIYKKRSLLPNPIFIMWSAKGTSANFPTKSKQYHFLSPENSFQVKCNHLFCTKNIQKCYETYDIII